MAEVTECRYDVRASRVLAFGLTSNRHFRIAYNYRVGEELHKGECFSEIAHLKGSLFPIHYDPDMPSSSPSNCVPRPFPLIVVGFVGAVALSLLVLELRRC